MDLLFSKYASPFLFMDGMIQTGRFAEFVDEFMKIYNDDKTWEVYLHKVFDKSYNDFKNSLGTGEEIEMSESQLETTVKNSKSVLNGFNPI